MIWLEWVITIGAALTAVIGVWKLIKTLVKLLDEIKETKEYVKKNVKNVESIPLIEEHCRENYLTGLRLTIMCEEMPLGERIVAGGKYLDLGGNGDVKKYLTDELHINDVQKD